LKEQNPAVRVIGVDPEGSIYTTEQLHTYKSRVSARISAGDFDRTMVDEWVQASDRDSFITAAG